MPEYVRRSISRVIDASGQCLSMYGYVIIIFWLIGEWRIVDMVITGCALTLGGNRVFI